MVLSRATGGNLGGIISLGLLLLVAVRVYRVSGQQVGVSLRLRGATIPSDSFVDLDDIMYTAPDVPPFTDLPSNRNPRDEALKCVTDLVDCCGTESDTPPGTVRTKRGDWYFPDGNRVGSDDYGIIFQTNRGPNEIINGRTVYGSVRLYRRYGLPPGRGRFRCELPSADNPSVNHTLYANILNFDPVTISPSTGSTATTAGERNYSLNCSATLTDPSRLPSGVPSPNFQWSFNGSASLPSGVTAMPTVMSSSNSNSETYTSTLQFSSPLSQSLHTGMYTCRLGAANLVNSAMVTVNAPPIAVMVTSNLNTPVVVGQIGYTLTCDLSGADNLNPMITYQWTRNDGTTRTQVGTNSNVLSFSSIRLSNAGEYTCTATIVSALINSDITVSAAHRMIIQIPDPQSVSLSSDPVTPVISGRDVTLVCTVRMRQDHIMDSEIFLLMADSQIFWPDGTPLTTTGPSVTGTTFTYTAQLNSFGRNDSGNYTCNATVRAQPSAMYLTGIATMVVTARITTGVYFSIRSREVNGYANNSNIFITDIGEGDCGALLCYTDLTECCGDGDTPVGVGALGQWVYPNGSVVGTESDGQGFYINRGPSVVRLNRRRNVTSMTGLFCCEVPDATARNTKICVNVVPFAPQSTPEATCMSDMSKVVYAVIGVAAILVIESLIGAPIIVTVVLCRKRRGKSRGKNIYDIHNVIAENKFHNGPKKDAYELSTTPTAPTTTLNSRALREDVYEDPDHANHMVGNHTNTTGERNSEMDDTYELMEANTLQGAVAGEDGNLVYTYVNTPGSMANTAPPRVHVATTTAEQPGGEGEGDDTYEIPDRDIVDTSAAHSVTLAVPGAQGGGGDNGVRESVYEDPDNPTHQPPVRFQLTECQAYT